MLRSNAKSAFLGNPNLLLEKLFRIPKREGIKSPLPLGEGGG